MRTFISRVLLLTVLAAPTALLPPATLAASWSAKTPSHLMRRFPYRIFGHSVLVAQILAFESGATPAIRPPARRRGATPLFSLGGESSMCECQHLRFSSFLSLESGQWVGLESSHGAGCKELESMR